MTTWPLRPVGGLPELRAGLGAQQCVADDWRPYTDGRWVPTENGYVFESEEPLGLGHLPLRQLDAHRRLWLGLVAGTHLVPLHRGVAHNPRQLPGGQLLRWLGPHPPPDYTPPEGYAPAGYYSGMPADSLLTSPFWIFAQAASFLLGLGQPYTPAYSYAYQPCLVPVEYVPVFFGQTVPCPGYYAPSYYPAGYFARGFVGAYSYGPPASFVTRHADIDPGAFNRAINYNTANITRFHNVTAPPGVLSGNPALRNIQPQALTEGRPLPRTREISNINLARAATCINLT